METIILYSTGCPKCKVLEKKLDAIGANYKIENDISEITKLGYSTVPLLKVGDNILDFSEAVRYLAR